MREAVGDAVVVAVGVRLAVAVAVTVALAVRVKLAVALDVDVTVGDAVAVAVGVWLAVAIRAIAVSSSVGDDGMVGVSGASMSIRQPESIPNKKTAPSKNNHCFVMFLF
jgi:hypothetical protein